MLNILILFFNENVLVQAPQSEVGYPCMARQSKGYLSKLKFMKTIVINRILEGIKNCTNDSTRYKHPNIYLLSHQECFIAVPPSKTKEFHLVHRMLSHSYDISRS